MARPGDPIGAAGSVEPTGPAETTAAPGDGQAGSLLPATVGLVGVGRAGAAVGRALAAAGVETAVVHVRSTSSALRAARAFPSARLESPAGVAAECDLVLLGVPDDALAQVAAEIATAGATHPGQVVAHLSGRHGLAVLEPVRAGGAARAAIHPIMTLAGTERDAMLLRGAAFGVTADPEARAVAHAVVTAAGGRYVAVPEKGRAAYHASLTLSANYLATLVAAGGDLMARAGVDDPLPALGPLLAATLDNALAEGPAAMTGPVRRGDAGTVAAHLSVIAASGLPAAAADAYGSLGRLTADYLLLSGTARREALAEVMGMLEAWEHRDRRARDRDRYDRARGGADDETSA